MSDVFSRGTTSTAVTYTNPGPAGDTVPGSNTGTNPTLMPGSYVTGYINFNTSAVGDSDQDWFAVTLVAGQTYTFAMHGYGTDAMADPLLRLINPSGAQVAINDDHNANQFDALITYTVPAGAGGTYFISAQAFDTDNVTGRYILTMNQGTTPFLPVFTLEEVRDQLTHTYWLAEYNSPAHWDGVGNNQITFNVDGLEPERQILARLAFEIWDELTALDFVETPGVAAEITVDDASTGAFANFSTTNGFITSATVNVDPAWQGGDDSVNSYVLQTFIHEIGHALGLGHGGPYNGSADPVFDRSYANDSWIYSIMSYLSPDEVGTGSYRWTLTPQMADIAAMLSFYGLDSTTRTGNTVYGFNSNVGGLTGQLYDFTQYPALVNPNDFIATDGAPILTIYDAGGTDTLDVSGYSTAQYIDLRPGFWSDIGGLDNNIGIAVGTIIENAVGGSGNDTLYGNTAVNTLTGGLGGDVYWVQNTGDVVVEQAGQGVDGVVSTVTFTLAANVENLQLIGNANINAAGNGDANRLIGNAGNNILNGMGGVDFMQGLGGNDVYWVDSLGESVVEAAGQGIDGVVSTITYTLPVNVENLQVIGTANINATGNALDNRLTGNSGNNVLNGLVGADIMQGLAGNDVYWVDNVGDVVIEYGGGGIDGVISSINYTMTSGVENLQLGGASTIGVGNIYDNRITGNGLNNVLNGNLGYDVLIGAGGDDIFVFNSSITGGPNFDYLADFNDSGNDEIRLENAIYTALTSTGFLAANLFRDIGTGAQDADDVILYNSTTGALLYDSNGLAAGGVTQFAVVDVGTVITAADFYVI